MKRLNVDLLQEQIDQIRARQQEDQSEAGIITRAKHLLGGEPLPEPYALAGLAGKKRTPRSPTFDLWAPRTVTVIDQGIEVVATYPNYVVFHPDRRRNRAQRRADASTAGTGERHKRKAAGRKTFAIRKAAATAARAKKKGRGR